MDPHRAKALKFWKEDVTGAASLTHAAVADRKHVVTYISASGDAAAVLTLESPDGTVLWSKRFGAAFSFDTVLPPGEYECPTNTAVVLKISAGTNRELNMAGYEIGG